MLESLNFNFDGVDSTNYPIVNINVGNGLFTEFFLAPRTILEDKVRGNDKPYFQGIERQPLSFPLSFYFTDVWDEDMIREIVRWLDVDYYRPFYFTDSPDRILYCMPTDSPQILHNGLKNGYVTLNLRVDSPNVVSPTIMTDVYDYSTNPSGGTILSLENNGDAEIFVETWITKVGGGSVTITNNTNGGQIFELNNLSDGETIYIDGENDYIESDIPGVYHFDDMVGDYLSLKYGVNQLLIQGNCKLQFRVEYKYKNGIL
jgi:phage-related protein